MFAIVGLGNYGTQYVRTRHNAGFVILDELLSEDLWSFDKYARADLVYTHIGDREVVYAKPRTLMNRSGQTVKYLQKKHTLTPEQIIVIHDELDLPVGKVKISFDRGHGGNNGVRSIFQHVGSQKIVRVRIGVSLVHQETGERIAPDVLGNFSSEDFVRIQQLAPRIEEIVTAIVHEGPQNAMNVFNEQG